ncbi:MAG: cation:proton antiporter [Sulfurimonas sp.]|jgi:Kef-type K+ transport system membrane component KefB|uniref:cation:proton antiporter n=1 Tax=unclassified Sulfurimonas TaxID=2623549 RepID=UPI0008BBEB96|nr:MULTISPECIES: cation:proton antiporter [unclassified Sulfurimonas]MBS4069636.1 cation:proton antiporter [Sulfurimonas sp.]MDD3854522.1 cation:proton antiporter [Sulfurimonas sp.]OHE05010.1 MAG: sodium:proton antiporter [Sulfurimonas sp. RIFOXYB12_FULL_35_9]OHE20641.1 MAG: sodium:proton antiporter [Sulfurimonas sp. RIFOXYD12_FULL_36_11]
MSSSALFIGIAFLIVISPVFSKITKLPIVVVEILLGSIAVWIGFLDPNNEVFKYLSKIGFFYLMFLAGLEINLKNFVAQRGKLLKSAIVYFIALYSLSIGIYMFFDLNPVYIVIIPIVSLGMIMALINEYGKKFKWLEIVLIVGVIGEIISISAIVIYESYIHNGVGFELFKNISIFFIVLFLIYQSFKLLNILFWWFPELKTLIMPEDDSKVESVRISAALFILLIAIMNILHIDMVLGAFFAGIYIANFFEHKKDLPHTLHKVGFGFLVPIFFIYVGTTMDLNLIFSAEILYHALLILSALIFVRVVSSYLAYSSHLDPVETFLLALGDSMPLTFIIAIATIAYEATLIAKNEYLSLIVAGMLSGVIIMSLLKFLIAYIYKTKVE